MPAKKKLNGYEVPIEWVIPEDIFPRFASNMVIQHLENEFLISFFEIKPPIRIGEVNEVEKIDKVKADCVCQVIVSEKKLPEFIKVLEESLQKALAKHKDDKE